MLITCCILCNQNTEISCICDKCHEDLILCVDTKSENNCFYYRPPVSILIKKFKYEENLIAAKILTTIAAKKFANYFNKFPAIIPMPVNKNRLQERGLHSTDYLVRLMIRKQTSKITIMNSFGWRTKLAKPQKSFKKSQRINNIDSSHFIIPDLEYNKYLVFDDVITTGTTWQSFKKAGKNLELQLITLAKKCYNDDLLNL